jgi:hypothetical protein
MGSARQPPHRERSVVFVMVCVPVFAVAMAAALHTLRTATNQCDNMAGTCIHMRQQAVILGIRLACLVAVVVPVAVANMAISSPKSVGRVGAGLLALCAAIAIVTLATDPLPHLNNRWHGWLSGSP